MRGHDGRHIRTPSAGREKDIVSRDEEVMSPSMRLGVPPMIARSGRGATLVDSNGAEFLDLHAMAGISNVGHAHPTVVSAISSQAAELVHANPAYCHHQHVTTLAEKLVQITPGDFSKKVAFGLSGSDANDGALKLVRVATGRPKVVSFLHSYHGNTYGALSLSAHSCSMRRGFGPVVPDIYHIPFPDPYRGVDGSTTEVADRCLGRLQELFETVAPPEEIAAVFIEPIQGDAGVIVPPDGFMAALRHVCDQHGILLVAEEVQTGMGRTGDWFAGPGVGLEPDVIVVGKALASGLPLSAIVARASLMDHWNAPGHVFSTGANPICCAAALAVINVIENENLCRHAVVAGERLMKGLRELAKFTPEIGDVRGRGLMIGVDLVSGKDSTRSNPRLAALTSWAAHRRGAFVTVLRGSVLRILPPLVITNDEVDYALEVLSSALNEARAGLVEGADLARMEGW